jgi:hypothetical protein
MTKKQNKQHDKQRSQKDSLHNDQKQNEQHDKQRSQDSLHNDQKNKMNYMTNNDHRRTAYTMTKKQNKQHDKQRSQKDSLHKDKKTK